MKLLIVTQKVDSADPILGFFHTWIMEFAKHCEKVTVICLEEGKYDLPHNVTVFSLGKEKHVSRIHYITRFYQLIWKHHNEYDTVFVHMNPEYVVLGGPIWKLSDKTISLWYVHRQVNAKLRIAEIFADAIFTSAKESFCLESKKVHYVGHGIDIEKLEHVPPAVMSPLSMVHVGRISRIKNLATIIKALKYLIDDHVDATLHLVGETVTADDKIYKAELQLLIQGLQLGKRVFWDGVKPNTVAFTGASITVNAAPHGGMDKAVLESLAARRGVFASNKAFAGVFGTYAGMFLYQEKDSMDLARRIKSFLQSDTTTSVGILSNEVRSKYAVTTLINTLVSIMNHV